MTVPLWSAIGFVLVCGLLTGLLICASTQASLARIERDYWKKRARLDAYLWKQYRHILRFTTGRMDRETAGLVALRMERIDRELAAGMHASATDQDED